MGKVFTGAPRRQRRSVARDSIVRRASVAGLPTCPKEPKASGYAGRRGKPSSSPSGDTSMTLSALIISVAD